MDHPDDQPDDPVTLRENLRHVRKVLVQKRAEAAFLNALVTSMREQLEVENELRQSWIEVFDMEMNTNGKWIFDSSQSELWNMHLELLETHDKLLVDWNKFVGQYNAVVGEPRAKGRPLHASQAQIETVTRMLAGKATYSVIIAATGLSLQTVRTIAGREGKDRNERRKLARRESVRDAVRRFRGRNRRRLLLEDQVNAVEARTKALIREAKGLK